ncbi:hypothetical protein SISSUDRAFT_629050 [Sistotremastrum suecicum HHB10207 ss-3]|uniref:Uncharacterized protein n=1 Tax=Sistotremastrum suecicum HHB10207 ss-3 TaxID=1314776 RepID=A0A166EG85_9AGAM|nr:hypothetical protein SISSUDRAFT_629050 [Sistotremastrum suecicum HHB10207 ss-3]
MTIQHKRREAVGKRWLLRLMGVLFSTLLLSILLFMTAFLLQAWVVAYSQPTPQPVLIAAAVIVAGLVLAIMIIIIATTFHAVKWENSPFETPLSSLLRRLLPDLSEEEDDEDGDEEDVGDLLEVKKDDDEDVETLKVYAGVVLNATEPETLEYAVPSYRWNDWLLFKDDLLPLFEAVYERFMASDTSIRVKETVIQHLIEFRKGTIFFHHEGQENKVADWCWSTCQDLCTQSHDLHARLFPLQILFTLELPNNENFRDLLQAPYVECMNRVLASYDLDGNLGEREDIFSSAVIECSSLLSDKKEDLVTQILSTRPFSILKSLIKSSMEIHDMKELVSFIVEGPEITLLNEMSELVSNPPEGRAIKILAFLDVLTRSPPPDLTVPDHFDLSRSLFGLTRSDLGSSDWINYSKVLIYLFDHGAFDRLTDPCAALPFLKWLCTRSGEEAERATFYLNNYATRFTEATELLPGDRRSLITDLSTFAHDLEADAGGNATTIFVKAFDRCNALLLSDHPLDLSREESVLILRSVLRNPILDWNNIRHFMRRVPRDHEMGWEVIIQALNQGKVPYVGWFLSPMSFFCSLLEERGFIRFIDSDIDISPLLAHLTSHKPHIGSWTRYSNALISCIDRGNVFERITDRASARKFFELCLNKDYETFEDDRESAKYYLKQLDRQDILARTSRRPHLLARACNNLTKRLGIASKVKSTELATAEAHMSLEMEEPPSVLPDISDPDREDTATSNPQS